MKTLNKIGCILIMCVVFILGLCSCGQNGKRDRRYLIDSSIFHVGTLKGYASVYEIDFLNDTYRRDDAYTDEIPGYPVYKKMNGDYYIRYKGQDVLLQRATNEYKLGKYISLKWMLDYNHYIEDIPRQW